MSLLDIQSKYKLKKIKPNHKLYFKRYPHAIRFSASSKIPASKVHLYRIKHKLETVLGIRIRQTHGAGSEVVAYTSDVVNILEMLTDTERQLVAVIEYMSDEIHEAYQKLAEDKENSFVPNTRHIIMQNPVKYRYVIHLQHKVYYRLNDEQVKDLFDVLVADKDVNVTNRWLERSRYYKLSFQTKSLNCVTTLSLMHGGIIHRVEEFVSDEEVLKN